MRLSVPAAVASACLLPLGAGFAAVPTPAPAAPPATSPPPASDSDAAARHVRRTACLKQAKDKKLVAAARDAFVKECVAGR